MERLNLAAFYVIIETNYYKLTAFPWFLDFLKYRGITIAKRGFQWKNSFRNHEAQKQVSSMLITCHLFILSNQIKDI